MLTICCIYLLVICLFEAINQNTVSYFYFKSNRLRWKKLNWVGIIFFTLLFNVLFFPLAIFHWVFVLFAYIFTAKRRG